MDRSLVEVYAPANEIAWFSVDDTRIAACPFMVDEATCNSQVVGVYDKLDDGSFEYFDSFCTE
ncbi:MAG: hypothetical protein AAFZ58_02580 [Pseudomonadota bacterium]